MNEIHVASWNELHERLFDESWQENLGRFRSYYAFRGMRDASYDLRTSLSRLGGAYDRLEANMLRNFRKYAQRNDVPGDSVWNWLSVAQHHGLPTRMLDWTYSPYVALHFATEDTRRYDVDGVIWAVNYVETNRYLPEKLKTILAEEKETVFTAEMLARSAASLDSFGRLSSEPFVAFFEPPSLDERIVNQFALFCLMSSATARLDHWLSEHPDVWRKIIIPAELKWEIRDKLDQANITERVLFPGLDGLSRWLARYYSPRGPQA
jgi:hypothetical protein